jgi:hypothetical protein
VPTPRTTAAVAASGVRTLLDLRGP